MPQVKDLHKNFHLNKNERLKSFESMLKNIFDEKLNKFGNCYEKPKNSKNITHVQIFDCYGNYYFITIYNNLSKSLMRFDEEDKNSKRYILLELST